MQYLELALVIGTVVFGLLGFLDALSVGNLTYAALSLGVLLFVRLFLYLRFWFLSQLQGAYPEEEGGGTG